MSQKNPKKMIALTISIAAHAALIYYLGKMALDYALPEGEVTSYEINYNSGEQTENVNVDVVSTPPPAPQVTTPSPTPNQAPTPEPKTAVATALPSKAETPTTEDQSAPPVAIDPTVAEQDNYVAKEPEANVPAIDPFAEELDKKALDQATQEAPTEAPVAEPLPAGNDTAAQSYGTPDGVQSDTVLTPAAGNKKISYPTMARFRKLEGETIVHYTVGGDGAVTDVKLVKSSGHDVLDDSVIETVKTWKFNPTGSEGVYERPVKFSLKGDAVPAPSKLRRSN